MATRLQDTGATAAHGMGIINRLLKIGFKALSLRCETERRQASEVVDDSKEYCMADTIKLVHI